MKVIQIVVSPTGNTSVETKGFAGGECREASKFIEQALGKQSEEKLTEEFFDLSEGHSIQQQQT